MNDPHTAVVGRRRAKAAPIVIRVELSEATYLRLHRRCIRQGTTIGAFAREAIAERLKGER